MTKRKVADLTTEEKQLKRALKDTTTADINDLEEFDPSSLDELENYLAKATRINKLSSLNLEFLDDISGGQLEKLAEIAAGKLEYLNLCSKIFLEVQEMLNIIQSNVNLDMLVLQETDITDYALIEISKTNHNIEVLNLNYGPEVNLAGIAAIVKANPLLTDLMLDGFEDIDKYELAVILRENPQIEALYYNDETFEGARLKQFIASGLKHLDEPAENASNRAASAAIMPSQTGGFVRRVPPPINTGFTEAIDRETIDSARTVGSPATRR